MNATNNNDATTWLSAAFKEIQRCHHLNDELCDILRAFGKDESDAPGPTNLDPDAMDIAICSGEDSSIDAIPYLQKRISSELLGEIDADQASMFGRRFSSVATLLKDENKDHTSVVTTNQLLRLALHRRTVQILSTSDPVLSQRKALRIRALVDFIWSQSLVLSLKDSPTNDQHPTLVQLARKQQSSSTEFSTGFHHSTIEGITSDFGPVHINVLRIDLNKSSCQMKCIDARKRNCTDLATLAKQMGAVAAISGGFFLYSEPDIELPSMRTDPVGLHVSDGNIIGPPTFCRAAILQKMGENGDRTIGLDKVGMEGVTCSFVVQSASSTFTQQSIKLTVGQDDVRCIHRGSAEEVVIEAHDCAFSIVGSTIVARKFSSSSTVMQVPLAGFVLVFPQSFLPDGIDIVCDDVTIDITYSLPSTHSNVENAMAGGPMFFSDTCHSMDLPSEDFRGSAPPVTFSQDETHDHNLLPRMGVGIAKCAVSDSEQLVCVAVDGRNLDRALGLTLQGTSDLLRSLGCTRAMNLDGGSSKRMIIWDEKLKTHKVVCLSTTEIKANANGDKSGSGKTAAEHSRPVHSAILFLPGKETPDTDR
ncbi:hypothetical protein ACHAXR_011796 [Thalassiosira sp. AJA248-18]